MNEQNELNTALRKKSIFINMMQKEYLWICRNVKGRKFCFNSSSNFLIPCVEFITTELLMLHFA